MTETEHRDCTDCFALPGSDNARSRTSRAAVGSARLGTPPIARLALVKSRGSGSGSGCCWRSSLGGVKPAPEGLFALAVVCCRC